MLGLGMASSHAPMMFQKAQYWPRVVGRIPAEAREQLPRSAREEIATPAIIDGHVQRIEGGLATLREQLRAYRPDALLMIGDDQGDLFDETNNPTFSVYTGEEPLWGRSARDAYASRPRSARRSSSAAPDLSAPRGADQGGFDVANIGRFDPRGSRARVSHMVSTSCRGGPVSRSRWSACS
jgi:protocatechuate 4,5-dioxygenase beta chain